MRCCVFTLFHKSEFAETISDTAMPAPSSLHSWRKGRSVTPAMGARMTLLSRWKGPIRKTAPRLPRGIGRHDTPKRGGDKEAISSVLWASSARPTRREDEWEKKNIYD